MAFVQADQRLRVLGTRVVSKLEFGASPMKTHRASMTMDEFPQKPRSPSVAMVAS